MEFHCLENLVPVKPLTKYTPSFISFQFLPVQDSFRGITVRIYFILQSLSESEAYIALVHYQDNVADLEIYGYNAMFQPCYQKNQRCISVMAAVRSGWSCCGQSNFKIDLAFLSVLFFHCCSVILLMNLLFKQIFESRFLSQTFLSNRKYFCIKKHINYNISIKKDFLFYKRSDTVARADDQQTVR